MLLSALVERAVVRGWLARSYTGTAERVTMADFRFMVGFVLTTGILAISAQYLLFRGRSFPVDLGFHPVEMIVFTALLMLLVDTNGFFWHRFSHRNPRAFARFHAGHHRTGEAIHVGMGFQSNTVWDYPLHSGITLSLGVSLLPLVTGRYPLVTVVYALTVYVL